MTAPEVRRARDQAEIDAALELRRVVFIEEQGVSLPGELDGRDAEAVHLVAVDADGSVLGTCRVVFDADQARFGRLCVRADARRQGLGEALLAEAEREARAAGARRMGLAAQTGALGLYERAGYTAYGERFQDEGIEHLGMEKHL